MNSHFLLSLSLLCYFLTSFFCLQSSSSSPPFSLSLFTSLFCSGGEQFDFYFVMEKYIFLSIANSFVRNISLLTLPTKAKKLGYVKKCDINPYLLIQKINEKNDNHNNKTIGKKLLLLFSIMFLMVSPDAQLKCLEWLLFTFYNMLLMYNVL